MSVIHLPQGVRHSSTEDEDIVSWLNILVRPDACGIVWMLVVTVPVLATLIVFHQALADHFELTASCVLITGIALFVMSGWEPVFAIWLRYVSRETLAISARRFRLRRRGPFISDTIDIEYGELVAIHFGTYKGENCVSLQIVFQPRDNGLRSERLAFAMHRTSQAVLYELLRHVLEKRDWHVEFCSDFQGKQLPANTA